MTKISRRRALELLAATGAHGLLGCRSEPAPRREARTEAVPRTEPPGQTGSDAVLSVEPLTTPWQTRDPFLFCMHHDDRYPPGNGVLGPDPSLLAGRRMGNDFAGIDGWRMYHGETVPGFPRHPHRGFETVTIVREGLLDHSDSLGATARYGQGDVQWLTAGGGILHAEMFPLLKSAQANPLELFQIWLNLPSASKMVEAHFSMLWKPAIPTRIAQDGTGKSTRLTIVAGSYEGTRAPSAPPHSWASRADSHVAIWNLRMEPGARFTLPAGPSGAIRSLYFFQGSELSVGGRSVPSYHHVAVHPGSDLDLQAGTQTVELLMLQGMPIGEPVARHGPFVMNTSSEIRQAYADYRRTQFGGWPWPSDEHVHQREQGRFARRPNGEIERPPA